MADRSRPANTFSDRVPGTTRPDEPARPDPGGPVGSPAWPVNAPPPAAGSQNSDIAEQAQQTIGHVADRAGSVVTAQIERQKERAASGLDSVAGALEQAATHFADEKTGLEEYVDSAASQVRALSSYLRSNDVAEVIDDVEDFARRKPAFVIGGAFLLGFLGARFLASSRPTTAPARRPMPTSQPAIRPGIPAM